MVSPTGTSPASTAIFSSVPAKSASTSCVTFSVSSSYSGSPFSTCSPSCLSHLTIVPDSIPCPSRGSFTSLATAGGLSDRVEHVGLVGHDVVLHHGSEGNGSEARPYALHRSVEPVECLVLDDRRDLRPEAHPRDRLVCDDAAVGLLDGGDEPLLVEWQERTWIPHFDRDPLAVGGVRRPERLVYEPAGRDHGDVLAFAMH